eukprot:7564071-Alexandrium_andersonii.AAC.1
MRSILRAAVNAQLPLGDIVQAGLTILGPDLLRAQAADMREAALAERERGLMVEAGRRALYREPFPAAGGAAPCSDDGPGPQ